MRCARLLIGINFVAVSTVFTNPVQADSPPALLPEPDGIDKNRFISFSFPDAPEGTEWAIRVTLVKMYNTDPNDPDNESCPPRTPDLPDLSAFEGQVRWVGPPDNFAERYGSEDPNQWIGAALQCCPNFQDWTREIDPLCAPRCSVTTCSFDPNFTPCSSDDDCPPPICDTTVLHVFGPAVVPCSEYEVQLVDVGCPDLADESCFSEPLTIHTAKWGDVWEALGGAGQPNFIDIVKVVDKFRGRTPPMKVQALLWGNNVCANCVFHHIQIARAVNAFVGRPYFEVGPSGCEDPCE